MTYFMIRKFLDAGVAEPRIKLGASFDSTELSTGTEEVETIDDKVEKKEDKEEVKVEDKKEEKVEAKAEEKKEDKKEEAKAEEKKEPAAPDWKEIIPKLNRKEVLSLLNIDEDAVTAASDLTKDEFAKKLLTYRKQHGNVTPFIEAATTDWTKFSHEQLIMDDLKKQYSSLSSEKAEKLAKSDYSQRFVYKDDPDISEADNREMAELMAIKLEAEGEKVRAAKIASQKEFLDSVKPAEKKEDEVAKVIDEHKKKTGEDAAKFKAQIEANPVTAKLLASKQIVLGKGDESFNRTVNPTTILEQTFDVNKFDDLFWDDGKFNVEKWAKVSAYANDIEGWEQELITHGRSLENKKTDKELENAKEEKSDKKDTKKKSLAKTFVEEGVAITADQL